MFIPFISTPETKRSSLGKRKGGGGHGGGDGGGESGGGSSSGGSSSSGGASSSPHSVPISPGSSGKSSATSYGTGGGTAKTIPAGSLFSGRSEGGGTRGNVYGNQFYGSGYPGIAGRGVAGRGFPFFFWPVVFVGGGAGSGAYLHDTEYGDPTNSSRPGGAMTEATFISSNTTLNTTFHILADNSTTTALISSIDANCSSFLSSSSSSAAFNYNASSSSAPQPEQAVQYYRASSVVLTLDGYNDTSVFTNDSTIPATPLPTTIDTSLLNCLNFTIGESVPLVDGVSMRYAPSSSLGLLALVWLLWGACSTL